MNNQATVFATKSRIDTPMTYMYTAEEVQSAIWQTLVTLEEQRTQSQSFDNLIDITGMLLGGNDMPRKWVTIGEDEQGKPIKKNVYGRTESELILKAAQLLRDSERAAQQEMPKQKTMFCNYAEKWLSEKARKKAKDTVRTYREALRGHILPFFGHRYIEDICRDDVQAFMDAKRHYARSTVDQFWTVLKNIFRMAIEDKIIKDNPAVSMRLDNPATRENKRGALTEEQMNDIADNLWKLSPQDQCLIALLMTIALRKGEALALRWEDIDFDNNQVRIERQADIHHRSEIKEPKWGSKGTVSLPEWTKKVILPYRKESGYIICAREGRPLSETTYNKRMKKIRETINLYGATAHIFRHTAITMVYHKCLDVSNVQAFARHKRFSTSQGYIHAENDKVRELGVVFDEIFKKNKNTFVA